VNDDSENGIDPFKQQTLTIKEVKLLEYIYDHSEPWPKEARLSGAQLRMAKRLHHRFDLIYNGRLSDRHYVCTNQGKHFVRRLRARRDVNVPI
jgi:hypothetical protein